MPITKVKGTIKSIFSIQFIALVLVLAAAGGAVIIFTDVVDEPWSDINDVDQKNETTLLVEIDSGHESDALVLRHPDAQEHIVLERELDAFGGEYQFHANSIRCDDANFPDREFELALVSVVTDGESLTGLGVENDETTSIELSEEFVSGNCSRD